MRKCPTDESKNMGLELNFGDLPRIEFPGAKVSCNIGLLAVRELDETIGLTDSAGGMIWYNKTGRNLYYERLRGQASRGVVIYKGDIRDSS